jgi:hypothetical protein
MYGPARVAFRPAHQIKPLPRRTTASADHSPETASPRQLRQHRCCSRSQPARSGSQGPLRLRLRGARGFVDAELSPPRPFGPAAASFAGEGNRAPWRPGPWVDWVLCRQGDRPSWGSAEAKAIVGGTRARLSREPAAPRESSRTRRLHELGGPATMPGRLNERSDGSAAGGSAANEDTRLRVGERQRRPGHLACLAGRSESSLWFAPELGRGSRDA